MSALVSIVIPTYNQAQYLKIALESLLAQTYGHWEAIVVNNFSNDDTQKVVESFSDPRIRFYNFSNGGVIAKARNEGIRHAKGEYVAFLDSDDTWYPRKLELCLPLFERADLVWHGTRIVKEGKTLTFINNTQILRPSFEQLLYRGNCVATSSVIVKKSALEEVGSFKEIPDYVTAEDYDLWLRLAHAGFRLELLPTVLGDYLVHSSGASRNAYRNLKAASAVVHAHHKRLGQNGFSAARNLLDRESSLLRGAGATASVASEHALAVRFLVNAVQTYPLGVKNYIALLRELFLCFPNARKLSLAVFSLCFFFVANTLYFRELTLAIAESGEDFLPGMLYYTHIIADYKAYIGNIELMKLGEFKLGLNNNTGVAFIYFGLMKFIGLDTEHLPYLAFALNNVLILLSFFLFRKILFKLELPRHYQWFFFLNPALVYYSQLVYKEIPSLFFILLLTYGLMQRRWFGVVVASLASALVRLQLSPVGILAFIGYRMRSFLPFALCVYILISLAGAVLFKPEILSYQYGAMGEGVVGITSALNEKYFIGSLLLNPLKAVQYYYDVIRSVSFVDFGESHIDIYKLRDVPFALFLLFLTPALLRCFLNIRYFMSTHARALMVVILMYVTVLFLNPIVHARYLFPISYLCVLLGLFVKKGRGRFGGAREPSLLQ